MTLNEFELVLALFYPAYRLSFTLRPYQQSSSCESMCLTHCFLLIFYIWLPNCLPVDWLSESRMFFLYTRSKCRWNTILS